MSAHRTDYRVNDRVRLRHHDIFGTVIGPPASGNILVVMVLWDVASHSNRGTDNYPMPIERSGIVLVSRPITHDGIHPDEPMYFERPITFEDMIRNDALQMLREGEPRRNREEWGCNHFPTCGPGCDR
jgi:hypothetical protein